MDFFDINKLSKFIGSGFSRNRLFVYDDDIIITSLIDYKFFIELRRACKFLQGADIGSKKNSIMGSRIPYKRERPFRFHFHKLKQETQTLLNFCNKVIHSSSIGSLHDEIRHPGTDDLFLISADDGYAYIYEEHKVVKEIHNFFDLMQESFGLIAFSYIRKVLQEKKRLLSEEKSVEELTRGLEFPTGNVLGELLRSLHSETQKDRSLKQEIFGYLKEKYGFPFDPQIYQLSEFGGSVSSTEVAVALSVAKNSTPNESFLGSRYLGCDQIIQLLNHILSLLQDKN